MDYPGLGKLCGDDIDTEGRYNIRFVSKMPSCVGLLSGIFESPVDTAAEFTPAFFPADSKHYQP